MLSWLVLSIDSFRDQCPSILHVHVLEHCSFPSISIMLLNMKFWVVLDVHLFVTNDVSMLNSTSRAVLQLAENLNFVLLCIMAKKHC